MGRHVYSLYAFNRGLVSRLGLGRTDVKRLAMSAETMVNWIPRILGSMMLRPGLKYIGATASNAAAKCIPFVFSTTDTALLELTSAVMRVWIDDALVTRPTVTATTASFSSWTKTAGATVVSGSLQFIGNGTVFQTAYDTVTVAAGYLSVEHALRIVVTRGPVEFMVGSSIGGEQYVTKTTLRTGTHSIAFTPTASPVYIQFQSRLERSTLVASCQVESAGVLTLPTPWTSTYLDDVRSDQSGDIVFVACAGLQQRLISRRASTSWSIETYESDDGPHGLVNTTPTTLTGSDITGDITLTASTNLFTSANVGSLYSMVSTGQTVNKTMSALNDATNGVLVTGVGVDRTLTIVISGFTGGGRTVILERSFDNSTWVAVSTYTWTADVTTSYADGLDNSEVYYRLKLSVVGTAGDTEATLTIPTGSTEGVARVLAYVNPTTVTAQVLSPLGNTSATTTWSESEWSSRRGWPSAVALHEGRLWFAGKSKLWGSAVDNFTSNDTHLTTPDAAIARSIGTGPVDSVNWLLSSLRLLIGTSGTEFSARSSALDEPITPTAFVIKPAGTQGSSPVPALKLDAKAIYVQRNGVRVYELAYTANSLAPDYGPTDLTQLTPTIGSPGITRIAIQRQPDTRIHCVRSDGTVALMIYDRNEDVTCWCEVTTDGLIEDVVVLPGDSGDIEDQVYYVVARTINSSTVRYLEKWATESVCRGAAISCNADSYVTYSGYETSTITGLSHLEGETVVVWGDGVDLGTDETTSPWSQTYTVSSGQITLNTPVTSAVVGLGYTADFLSTKLGRPNQRYETFLNQQQRISHLGLVLADYHPRGLRFGSDFDNLDLMPGIESGTAAGTAVGTSYDEQVIEFPGIWGTDTRLALRAVAPRPVTVLAATIDGELHD